MDPELKKTLDEVRALARDNHRLLRAVRRHQLFELFGRYVFWLIVIALSYYGYIAYLAPLVGKFAENPAASGGAFGIPTSADIQKLLHSYKPAP